MFSITNRANAVFTLAITVSMVVLAITSSVLPIVSFVSPIALEKPHFVANKILVQYESNPYQYGKKQVARFSFNLDADLSPLYTWNTKQLFVFVVAEYETKTHKNQITLWDDRITTKKGCRINLINQPIEYPFTHFSGSVAFIAKQRTESEYFTALEYCSFSWRFSE
ncbi:Signal peptidase complex subunit [Nowakowskiella sp. JEL0078]|nr:Signal peptidase complex subunit [Nowakowskiella sp. JEL0078]